MMEDGSNSVKSLLDLLKSTQDPSTSSEAGLSRKPWSPSHEAYDPLNPSHASSSRTPQRQSSFPSAPLPSPPTSSVNPIQRQLDDLLASLKNPPGSQSSSSSAFGGAKHNLIEPWGPVRKQQKFDHASLPAVLDSPSIGRTPSAESVTPKKREKGWDTMSFTKALPVISDLLQDEGFKRDVKKAG
jgi:hypothetical protein